MNKLAPNTYQLEQAKKFIPYFSEIEKDGLDYLLLASDDAFEWFDNIATEEYLKQGYELDLETKEPLNDAVFDDCRDWARDLIEKVLE